MRTCRDCGCLIYELHRPWCPQAQGASIIVDEEDCDEEAEKAPPSQEA